MVFWETFLFPYWGWIIGSIFAVFILSHMLHQRRPPASTVAWLLAIVLIPYIGIPLYILFGGRKIRQMAQKKEKILLGKFAELPRISAKPADRFLRSYGLPGATSNNQIQFHTDGQQSYQALIELIDRAQYSIHLATFILRVDEVGKDLLERLEKKAKQGLDVRLLLDSFGCRHVVWRSLKPFLDAGGQVAYFMPLLFRSIRAYLKFPGNAHLRNHRKLVVVDGIEVWAGGANFTEEYMGWRPSRKRWKDLTFTIQGEGARVYQEIFRNDWNFASVDQLPKPIEPKRMVVAGQEIIQIVPSGPDIPEDPFYTTILMASYTATERIWILSPYFIPDEGLMKAWTVAIHRGVDVRVIVPKKSNHWAADVARGSFLRDIQKAGGTVLLHHGVMMHAKALIIDQELAVAGSANMDPRSLFFNYEAVCFLYSQGGIAGVEAYITSLIKYCKVGVRRVSKIREIGAGIIRLFAPLL